MKKRRQRLVKFVLIFIYPSKIKFVFKVMQMFLNLRFKEGKADLIYRLTLLPIIILI